MAAVGPVVFVGLNQLDPLEDEPEYELDELGLLLGLGLGVNQDGPDEPLEPPEYEERDEPLDEPPEYEERDDPLDEPPE